MNRLLELNRAQTEIEIIFCSSKVFKLEWAEKLAMNVNVAAKAEP